MPGNKSQFFLISIRLIFLYVTRHQYFKHCFIQRYLVNKLFIILDRNNSSFVEQRLNCRRAETDSLFGKRFQIYIFCEFFVLCIESNYFQSFFCCFWQRHTELICKTTRSYQSGIQVFQSVSCCNNQDVFRFLKSIHLCQQSV